MASSSKSIALLIFIGAAVLLILKQTVSFESKLALAKRIANPATQLFHFHHRRQQGVKIYTQCVTCSDCGTTITPDVLICVQDTPQCCNFGVGITAYQCIASNDTCPIPPNSTSTTTFLSSAISSFTSVGATVASANLSAAATTSESTVQTTQGVSSQSQGSQSNNTQSNPPTQTASATSTPTVVLSNGQPRTMSDGLGRGSAVALLLLFAGSFYSLGAW